SIAADGRRTRSTRGTTHESTQQVVRTAASSDDRDGCRGRIRVGPARLRTWTGCAGTAREPWLESEPASAGGWHDAVSNRTLRGGGHRPDAVGIDANRQRAGCRARGTPHPENRSVRAGGRD